RCRDRGRRRARFGEVGMKDIFDFFPFNLGATEGWIVIYAMMVVPILLVTRAVRNAVGKALDGAAPRGTLAVAAAGPDVGYRMPAVPVTPPHQRLTIGSIPIGDEIWVVAYMRGGSEAVAASLVANAVAAGWLTPDPSGSYQIHRPPHRTDALMTAFLA